MKGKIVVVTGAGSGIGRTIAMDFAEADYKVVAADVMLPAAEKTVSEIEAAGGTGFALQVDVAKADSVENMVRQTLSKFNGINVLVNNAAIQVNRSVEDTDVEDWERELSVNVSGVFFSCKFFLPHLRVSQGCIVNVASVNGFFAEGGCAGYCATKGAIIALTKAMAIDHGRDGIRVNCICPGYIDTGLAERFFEGQPDPAAARQAAGELHAIGRIGRADEVSKTALFLAGPGATFITGATMVVDGGLSSGLPPAS